MSDLLRCVEFEPGGTARGSVVWMHGLGASAHDFDDVVPLLQLPDVRFVFPDAPQHAVTINGGLIMPAWYDITLMSTTGSENVRHVRESAAMIEALLEREHERGVPAERCVIAGFSQGGALGLFVGARYAQPLAGIMVLSGYEVLTETREAEASEANRATPLLFCHGTYDPMVDLRRAQAAYAAYAEGRPAEWHEFPMAHQMCLEEIEIVRDWLHTRFGEGQAAQVPGLTPALFVSHGAPSAALENDDYTRALAAFGSRRPAPRAIVVVSAHWEAPGPLRVNAAPRPELIYDFSGFPQELYRLTYPAPGSPDLAAEIVASLAAAGLHAAPETARGWDHGVWVPLRLGFPAATLPVVELSLPVPRTPELLLSVGRALEPLRERGVLIFGSGGVVHNLRLLRWGGMDGPADDWARAFDEWVMGRVLAGDLEALAAYRSRAPHAERAVPTSEHFDPLFVVLGAAQGARADLLYEGIRYGNLSLRSFALES